GHRLATLVPCTTLFRSRPRDRGLAVEVETEADDDPAPAREHLGEDAAHLATAAPARRLAARRQHDVVGPLQRRGRAGGGERVDRSEEHTSELQSRENLV